MNKNLWFFRSKMKKLMNETGIWVQNRAFVVLIIIIVTKVSVAAFG